MLLRVEIFARRAIDRVARRVAGHDETRVARREGPQRWEDDEVVLENAIGLRDPRFSAERRGCRSDPDRSRTGTEVEDRIARPRPEPILDVEFRAIVRLRETEHLEIRVEDTAVEGADERLFLLTGTGHDADA